MLGGDPSQGRGRRSFGGTRKEGARRRRGGGNCIGSPAARGLRRGGSLLWRIFCRLRGRAAHSGVGRLARILKRSAPLAVLRLQIQAANSCNPEPPPICGEDYKRRVDRRRRSGRPTRRVRHSRLRNRTSQNHIQVGQVCVLRTRCKAGVVQRRGYSRRISRTAHQS